MERYTNGMPAGGIEEAWVKSAASSGTGQCVQLAALPAGRVAMRNSTDPDGPALVFTSAELAAFLDGAKKGEFDRMSAS